MTLLPFRRAGESAWRFDLKGWRLILAVAGASGTAAAVPAPPPNGLTDPGPSVKGAMEASDRFSALLSNDFSFGPLGHGPVVRVRDVVMCPPVPTPDAPDDVWRHHPPAASPRWEREHGEGASVDLGRGVRLDRLSPDERDLVMHACAPRGHYFVPVRPPAQRYSLIRDVDPKEADQRLEWDPDSVLRDALMLARLVRDNNHSTEYAARVTNYDDGQQMVMPSPLPATQVYRLRQDRDWLDDAEADQLRDLLASYWAVQDDLPRRVRAATLRVEYAGWSPWADAMLPTLVGGLEALLKTEQHAASRQFTTRVPLVAEELGIDGLSASVCKRLYKARSEWVHGAHVRLFSGLGDVDAAEGAGAHTGEQRTVLTDIARLQDVLRAAARKAIEDEEFRAVFTQHDRIRERWPVDLTPPRQPRLARLRRSFTHAAGSVRDSLRRRAR